MYAEIVLSKTSRGIDKLFHYSVPAELSGRLKVGHQVMVPFGRRKEIGYVVGFAEKAEVAKVKEVLAIVSEQPVFNEKQVELARWMADHYQSFFLTALRLMMPVGMAGREGKRPKAQGQRPEEKSSSAPQPNQTPLAPTEEQEAALREITAAVDQDKPEKFLLYGVTGSGKTEVYMQAVSHILSKGKSAIVLVPEIALTPQLVQRFSNRFGSQIAVLHSHMTPKQRRTEWARAASGEAKIILGARSAIFAPVKDLGLVVIDEEFETSYKQDKSPRYHVREVAFYLVEQHNAVVILGSATPSVETYYLAEQGEYRKLTLTRRIDDRPLPPVEIVDMRKRGNYLLSDKLREALGQTLEKGEQAILFINRRGFFTFVMCHDCGYPVECPHCSISLAYHSDEKRVCCNHCGYSAETPSTCSRCNSSAIRYFGIGTQRIENEVRQAFPDARVLRYDSDSTGKRGSHDKFFEAFVQHKADILIGTQMVAKGLDLGNVTLVGVVSADTALRLPDFRSAERTFQLLTQVAGRAGRHQLPGRVIVQTYDPDNYAVVSAAQHDYEAFYQQEIKHRQELGYPPFSRLVSLLISGEDIKKVVKIADDLKVFLAKRLEQGILGPAPAVIPRLRGEWRYHILLKSNEQRATSNAVRETLARVVVPDDVKVTVDVDPMSLL